MDACESTAHEAWFLPAVACVAVLVVAVLALLWWWVKRNWDRWYHDLVKKAFDATDTDNDGSIEQDELWAGVLQLYGELVRAAPRGSRRSYLAVPAPCAQSASGSRTSLPTRRSART